MGHHVDTIATGFRFLEGPRWHDDRLFVSDFYQHKVFAFDDAGHQEVVAEVPGQPSGLGFAPDGTLLVVSMTDATVYRVMDGSLTVFAAVGEYVHGPANDMVVDNEGGAYVGNFGFPVDGSRPMVTTNLVRISPAGEVSVAAENMNFPNGTVITPDGRTLIVSETFAGRITAFDRASDGRLSNRRVWAAWGDPDYVDVDRATAELAVLPDGLALDAEGCLWVADAKGSGVCRVRQGGEVVDMVPTGDKSVYACALGGRDRRTLYLCVAPPLGTEAPDETTNGELRSVRVDVPGAGLP